MNVLHPNAMGTAEIVEPRSSALQPDLRDNEARYNEADSAHIRLLAEIMAARLLVQG